MYSSLEVKALFVKESQGTATTELTDQELEELNKEEDAA